jgi:hypothetical protein
MDNTQVLNAIESNDPAKVTSLANKFIGTFWNSLNLLNGGKTKDFITHINNGQKTFFHLDLDKYRGKSIHYMVMFPLWSCVSNKCFSISQPLYSTPEWTSKLMKRFHGPGWKILLSVLCLLQCFCITCMPQIIKNNIPAAKCYYWPNSSQKFPPFL